MLEVLAPRRRVLLQRGEHALRLVAADEERAIADHLARHPDTKHVCLFAQPINRIDVTGVDTFGQLHRQLASSGITLGEGSEARHYPITHLASAPAGVPEVAAKPSRAKTPKTQQRTHLTFGGDMPQRPGDYGIETVNGMTWLVRALEADETRKRKKDDEEEIHIQRLMPADALRIRGRHNALNALAALALAGNAGGDLAPMLFGLREYQGEPHRVEPVTVLNGVEYFDDSKGTNVGATVAALHGLGVDRRLVVILGGDGKGQDFAPLSEPVSRYARAVVLMGRDAPALREVLQHSGVTLLDATTLEDAVKLCSAQAQSGDAVLLSPACASMDMFRNYAHRAEVFVNAVNHLVEEAGGMV